MAGRPTETRGERSTWRTSGPPQEAPEVSGDAGGSAPSARGIPVALGARSC
jgi:hypothetical protein